MPEPGFIERFFASVERAPEAVAFESAEGAGPPLGYADLLALAERYRGAFRAFNVAPGDAVLLFLPSGPELAASFFALASLGAVSVPLHPKLTPYELRPIAGDARPVGLVAPAASLAAMTEALAAAGAPPLRFALAAAARPEALSAERSPLAPPPPGTVVSCHFTYKGLGYPLGALHRYEDYAVCLGALLERYPQEPGAAHLALLPLYPVYGLTSVLLLALAGGCRLVVAGGKVRDADLLELLERYRVHYTAFVPALFKRLVDRAHARAAAGGPPLLLRRDLTIFTGGSFLDPAVAAQVADATGVEPQQGYGLSETLPVVSNGAGRSRRGTLGTPLLPAIRVSIRGADGREVAVPGQAGEIFVGGPTVMTGYLARPRETARFLRDGWMRTGDLGALDADGFLHFVGRSVPIAKIAAQMVDLVEVETVLRDHVAVADARATVVHDPERGEQLGVSVMLRKGAKVKLGELMDLCARKLSPFKVPRRIKVYQRHLTPLEVPH